MICSGCCKNVKEVKGDVSSVIHRHSAANKAQKKIKATVVFWKVDGSGQAKICKECAKKIIDGMSNGGNFE